MAEFCRHFGLSPGGCEDRLQRLAAAAEGWPRHLHFAMQALGHEALEVDGDLSKADWQKIEREAAASRRRYYEDQISLEIRDSKLLTGAVMLGFRAGMDSADVCKLIDTCVRDEPGFDLPEGMNTRGFLACLTHKGALQRTAYKGMSTPIPSFRRYLIAAAGLNPDPVPPHERPESVEITGLLDEAAERLAFAGSKLGHEIQDGAVWSDLLDSSRSALSRLEQAGELAERLLSDSPDGAAALTAADRHRAKAEIALRYAVRTADTDPSVRFRDALDEAERQIRSARSALGADPDHGRTAERISQQTSADEDDAPSPM